jgi:uncharacterized LabA/DUF88 family protein
MINANISGKKERVIVYIDGFNLYFGIKEAEFPNCKWLDIKSMAKDLLLNNQIIIDIKYFTSRVSNDPEKQKRQGTFIEALENTGVKIYYGHYKTTQFHCRSCGATWSNYNEKMTDVNIATQLILDAYKDNYDMAMLISGDSDLVPPIKAIHETFPGKRVFAAFPPKRLNRSITVVTKGYLVIGRKMLSEHQLPLEIKKRDGFIINKPDVW